MEGRSGRTFARAPRDRHGHARLHAAGPLRRARIRSGRVPAGATPAATGHAGRAATLLLAVMLVLGLVPAGALGAMARPAVAEEVSYPGVRQYLAGNLDGTHAQVNKGSGLMRTAAVALGLAPEDGSDRLRDTGQLLYVKYTLANRDALEDGDTIDSIFADSDTAAEKIWAQYETIANVYDPGEGNCYVALLDSTALTGAGRTVDAAFAEHDNHGRAIGDITYDLERGIAYLPKSLYCGEDGNEEFHPMSAQLLVSYDFSGDRSTTLDVSLASHRWGVTCVADREAVTCDGIDPTIQIPVVDPACADRVCLDDLALYVGDSQRPIELVDGTNASYDRQTGTLGVTLAGVTASTLRVEVLDAGVASGLVDAITMPASAAAANSDRLGTWPYGLFDKLDLSKLREGMGFTYSATVKYDYTSDHFADIAWANLTYNRTIGYVYTSFDNAAGDGSVGSSNWVFSQMKNGTTWDAVKDYVSETPVSASPGDVNFMFALPGGHEAPTSIGGFDWSGLISPVNGFRNDPKYDGWIDAVAFCTHITQPDNALSIDDAYNDRRANVTMRVLKIVSAGANPYVVIGFCSPQVTSQSGISIIKFAVKAKGKVTIEKNSEEPTITDRSPAYTLAGAVYGLYSDPDCTKRVASMTTDANGKATSSEVDAGTYYLREDKAPKGFLKSEKVTKVAVDAGKTSSVGVSDKPCYSIGWSMLQKLDSELGNLPQGDATLKGARFRVNWFASGDGTSDTPDRSWVIETDAAGAISHNSATFVEGDPFLDSQGHPVMPLGTYVIREASAPKGYSPANESFRVALEMDPSTGAAVWRNLDGWFNDRTDTGFDGRGIDDEVLRGGVSVLKIDDELGDERSLGAATLEGTTFDVAYLGTNPVVVDGTTYSTGDIVASIVAKEGVAGIRAATSEDALPYGRYQLRERSAGTGYLTSDFASDFVVDGTGVVNLEKAATNRVARGGFRFNKVDGPTQHELAGIPFLVTAQSDTDGDGIHESHVVVTDRNGTFTTGHDVRDNANDAALLTDANGRETVDEKNLDPDHGVWFTGRTDATTSPVPGRGSLPYDTYVVRELPCQANAGKKLVTFSVVISDDGTVIDRGTVVDADGPAIATTLTDAETGFHVVPAGTVRLTDVVSYENLDRGKPYNLVGTLVDAETGEALTDSDGAELVSHTSFTPALSAGSVNVTFDLDASGLAGRHVVAFERLYSGDQEVARHEDPSDPDQSVGVARIGTTATCEGSHLASSRRKVTIQDAVTYEGLEEGASYRLVGQLVDADSGESVTLSSGEKTVESTFVPKTSAGTTEISFGVDGSALAGRQVVATEVLFRDGQRLASHEDLTDGGQTVSFPRIGTTLSDASGERSLSPNVDKLVDTISYEGLIPGDSYLIRGELVDTSTGEPAMDPEGNAITAETSFEATQGTGEVIVSFELPEDTNLPDSVTAFESLVDDGSREVAAHADLSNEDQTLRRAAIETTLVERESKEHMTQTTDGLIALVDTVSYRGLVPGATYQLEGMLITPDDSRPVDGSTTSIEFVPKESSGTIAVEFQLQADSLRGRDVVAFEYLSRNGEPVASHEDPSDDSQTVSFPAIGTTLLDGGSATHTTQPAERQRLIDTVRYENLVPGRTYQLVGTLVDAETGEPLAGTEGGPVVAMTQFVAAEKNGSQEVEFSVDTTSIEGHRVVAFERLSVDGTIVAVHEDPSDDEQSVTVQETPTAPTSARDAGKTPVTGEVAGAVAVIAAVGLVALVARSGIKPRRRR